MRLLAFVVTLTTMAILGVLSTNSIQAENLDYFEWTYKWSSDYNVEGYNVKVLTMRSGMKRDVSISTLEFDGYWSFRPHVMMTTTVWPGQPRIIYFDAGGPTFTTSDGMKFNVSGSPRCNNGEISFTTINGGKAIITSTKEFVPLRIALVPEPGVRWPWEKFSEGTSRTYTGSRSSVWVVDDRYPGMIECNNVWWNLNTATPTPTPTVTSTPQRAYFPIVGRSRQADW